ncbi:hypothetical protein ACFCX4_20245 [Kitasatospora sp. NPDC056327]|uniref:hypothetical protein n=1 Tax=Kitasatospora sp. NPDC056327 TaxID=3345785 RepID=UPI0035DA48A8
MTDTQTLGIVSLASTALSVLTPVVGAVVAGTFLRRRGRNARLAMIGCLVMAPGPLVFTVGVALGGTNFFGDDPVLAISIVSVATIPFHLVGLGLILAGALAAPDRAPVHTHPAYHPTDAPPHP